MSCGQSHAGQILGRQEKSNRQQTGRRGGGRGNHAGRKGRLEGTPCSEPLGSRRDSSAWDASPEASLFPVLPLLLPLLPASLSHRPSTPTKESICIPSADNLPDSHLVCLLSDPLPPLRSLRAGTRTCYALVCPQHRGPHLVHSRLLGSTWGREGP